MSYQVLARKWRPRIFREMVGQEHVLKALINALDFNRLHHAYLFTGTRGVGKTTIARILAKCLNCETGVSSEPCGQCGACQEIAEGRFVDLIEVDAASRTRVEDTRELLENVQYAPTRGRFKIYLIDEVHMLSTHSFNALLKTLEEPPEHVKFLLATTDPQKLPVTILSRCLQFNLKNMSPERIVGHLQFVLGEEVIPFDDSALWQLARAADGSMRDALSLTDQAIAYGGGKVADNDVVAMLGTIDHRLIEQLVRGLIQGSGPALLNAVASFSEHAPDYSSALADLITFLHRMAIAQAMPEALDNSYGDRKVILELSQLAAPEDVQLFYQTALIGRRDLHLSPDPRSGLEMTLLRMLAFKPQGVVDVPVTQLPASQKALHIQNHDAPQLSVPAGSAPEANTQENSVQEDNSQASNASVNNISVSNVSASHAQKESVQKESAQQENTQITNVGLHSASADMHNTTSEQYAPRAEVQDGQQVAQAQFSASSPEVVSSEPPPWQASPTDAPSTDSSSKSATVDPIPQQAAPALANVPSAETTQAEEATHAKKSLEALLNEPGLSGLKPASSIQSPAPKVLEQTPDSELVQEAHHAAPTDIESVQPEHWLPLYHALGIKGVLHSTVANSVLVSREGYQFHFWLDQNKGALFDESHRQRFNDVLNDYFKTPVKVYIELAELTPEMITPALDAEARKQKALADATASLQQEPLVQALAQHFDCSLNVASVKVTNTKSIAEKTAH